MPSFSLPYPKKMFFSAVTSRYDIFAINLASVMLGYFYSRTPGGALTY